MRSAADTSQRAVGTPPSGIGWRQLIVDVVTLVALLAPMVLSAATVAGGVYLTALAERWRWSHWLVLAPLLYVWWLLTFLTFSALICHRMGKKFPKPRYAVSGATHPAAPKPDLGMLTALVCYRRLAIVQTLPLIRLIDQTETLRRLVLRAYSPAVHMGRKVSNWGYIHDPDLTEIGDSVVIGSRATISAHSLSVRHDGAMVFVTAPVIIQSRATIGGEARISLGCVVGEDAIVEAGSVVAPFTRIPCGEVWGGNPASFQRMRDSMATATDPSRGHVVAVDPEELRRLVIDALKLPPDTVVDELNNRNCLAWDSLGQLALAAALYDRYGTAVEPREIFRLRSLIDIAEVVAGRKLGMADATPEVGAGLPFDEDDLPLLDRRAATRALAARFQGAPSGGRRIRVVIAASFTAEPMATTLTLWGRAFGFELDCHFAGYDQLLQTLLDANGPFALNRDGVNVLLTRPEDLGRGAADATDANAHTLLDAVAAFSAHAGEPLLVGTLPPVVSASFPANRDEVAALQHRWRTRLDGIARAEPFDFAHVVERLGIDAARSSGTEVLARGPYSPMLYQDLAIELVRRVRARHSSPAKVIALDCDNTLWGGVVGEAGLEGIVLGPEGPGRAFHLFQRYLKNLKEHGLLLVVVSRNEQRDVDDVFESHPEMILRASDIAGWRVNWNDKSQNIRELARELNLGLDAFVLLDDDPATRMEVKARVPEVHVIALPSDPVRYCEAMNRSWLFDGGAATGVDAARTRMMHEESRRRRDRNVAVSLDDYLASLELHVEISPPAGHEWPRVAQLTQRTNQFNLSLKRRTVEELKALATHALLLGLSARDRFGDYGLVGVSILKPTVQSEIWELDTLAVSCRALGRGVEDAFIHGIADVLAERGAKVLEARYVAGTRNQQITQFLARCRFEQREQDVWRVSLARIPRQAGHVTVQLSSPCAS